jgi:hypothetical protein
MRIEDVGGTRIMFIENDGPPISTPEESSDLIGNAWFEHVDVIGLPVGRIDPLFFDLGSQFAGRFTQKAVNYQVKIAVIGDVSAFEARSGAFRDFVWESNRGQHVWFVPDEAALAARLV